MLRQLIVCASTADLSASDSSRGSLLQLYAGQFVDVGYNMKYMVLATELSGMGRSASVIKATKQSLLLGARLCFKRTASSSKECAATLLVISYRAMASPLDSAFEPFIAFEGLPIQKINDLHQLRCAIKLNLLQIDGGLACQETDFTAASCGFDDVASCSFPRRRAAKTY
jgi:hypothetical protein